MGIDYYALLNLPRDCTLNEIKLAYRKYAIQVHPERKEYPKHATNSPENINCDLPIKNIVPNFNWEFINEAYDVLSNQLTRQVYDVYGEEGLKRGVIAPNGYIEPYVYHNDFMKTYCGVFGTYSPYADLIDAFVNPPPLYTTASGVGVKIKDKPVEKILYLDLKEIFRGGIKKMKILRNEFIDETKTITQIREKILTIPFAPGIIPGTSITFKEEGDQSPTKIPSDIIFIVADKPHGLFKRCGSTLKMVYNIDLKEALCGLRLTINTLDERKLTVVITDVITPNFVKIIPNEGLPLPYDLCLKGNLHISFNITYPNYIERSIKLKLENIFTEIYNKLEIKLDEFPKNVIKH